MPLLAIEKTVNSQNFINLAHDLTLEDVNLEEFSHFPESHDDISSRVYFGTHVSLKKETIDLIIEKANIQVRESGQFVSSSSLGGITDGWHSNQPSKFQAIAEEPVRYNGRKTNESKQKHLEEKINEVKARWETEKNDRLNSALKSLQEVIELFLSGHNETISESLRNIIVEQKVGNKWFDKNLSDKDSTTISTNEKEVSDLEKDIEAIKQKIKSRKDANYTIKRQTLEQAILNDNDIGEKTKAAIESFKGEEKEQDMMMIFS